MNDGDIYQLGKHRLACGSSSDAELIKRLIGEGHIALILCDPPYGVSVVQSKRGLTQQTAAHKVIVNDDIENEDEYKVFTEKWMETVKQYMATKNSIYIFNADKMLIPTVQALKSTGGKFAQLLIWAKTHAIIGRMDYLPQHELIVYGWFGTHKFHKSKDKSILIYPKPNKSKLHPTMKPIGLLRRLILNSSKVGDVVFDGFGGSGSTLIACEQTKRQCLMVELDSEYCEVIAGRWEKLTGQKRVKL